MRGILLEYGTAVHLALLTVAPLFLVGLCGPSTHAVFLGGLSLFGAMWIVMAPSPRRGEWPRDARHRIGWELARNPFLVLCVVALVIGVVRIANDGVTSVYDAGASLWRLKEPAVPLLPSSVSGHGWLPLAGFLGLTVVTLGVRHALNGRARFAYLFSSGLLAALAVIGWRVLSSHGLNIPSLATSLFNPFHLGSLLGVFFLFSITAWVESWTTQHASVEVLSAVSVAVLLSGLLFYAPAFPLLVFVVLGVIAIATSAALLVIRRTPVNWFCLLVSSAIVLSPVVLLVGEIPLPAIASVFPKGFMAVREAVSSVALSAWGSSTQLGVGLGAFPMAFGFFAKPETWQVLAVPPIAAPNGWIHFLFERGLLGTVVALTGVGLLLRDGILRFLRAGSAWSLRPSHLLGPLVFVAVVAVTFFECSYVQFEALIPVGAALGLTAAAFPDLTEVKDV